MYIRTIYCIVCKSVYTTVHNIGVTWLVKLRGGGAKSTMGIRSQVRKWG
jgi:hypothetical protein